MLEKRDEVDRWARGGSGASGERRSAGARAGGRNGVGPALLLDCGTAMLGLRPERPISGNGGRAGRSGPTGRKREAGLRA